MERRALRRSELMKLLAAFDIVETRKTKSGNIQVGGPKYHSKAVSYMILPSYGKADPEYSKGKVAGIRSEFELRDPWLSCHDFYNA